MLYIGLFDRFRKNNNGGTENPAVVDVDTNEDRLTPEELSRRSREIAAELETEQKKVQEIYNQTQVMFTQYNERMDKTNSSPYYNNGSASFLASSSETSQNGLVEMLEPGKITESGKNIGDNTSVTTQQIGQFSVGGISVQKELGKMVHKVVKM